MARLARALLVLLAAAALGPAAQPHVALASGGRTFYFAEGFTGPGFHESLTILMPSQAGTASITYQTGAGVQPAITRSIAAGVPFVEDVNRDVGPNQEVSAIVALSGAGVVERTIHFSNGIWHGSTDKVGVTAPSKEWDFAEGSTLSAFNEYLTLENPNPTAAVVDLRYFPSNNGVNFDKLLTITPESRTTIEVFSGNLGDSKACTAGAGGSCGVGRGFEGVSVDVSSTAPIVAERVMYVNGYDFGSGPIRDGHDDFGFTNTASGPFFFAEGTTLPGFYEYLTLENPRSTVAHVNIYYDDNLGRQTTRSLVLNPDSRDTVGVFDATDGVGRGVQGVSAEVASSDYGIVAERSIYMVHDFGSGPVSGADVAFWMNDFGKMFSFSNASTRAGNSDFLAIWNGEIGVSNKIEITYYSTSGRVTRSVIVPSSSRATVPIWEAQAGGLGPGIGPIGILVAADPVGGGPFLVELVSYSSNAATYGATDTFGYMSCLSTDFTSTCSP